MEVIPPGAASSAGSPGGSAVRSLAGSGTAVSGVTVCVTYETRDGDELENRRSVASHRTARFPFSIQVSRSWASCRTERSAKVGRVQLAEPECVRNQAYRPQHEDCARDAYPLSRNPPGLREIGLG